MDERVFNILNSNGSSLLVTILEMFEPTSNIINKDLTKLLLYILNSKKLKDNINLVKNEIHKILPFF